MRFNPDEAPDLPNHGWISAPFRRYWSRARKEAFLTRHVVGEYRGILLCDLKFRKPPKTFPEYVTDLFLYPTLYSPQDVPEIFRVWTLDALQLIEKYDPRRFQRIQKYLRYIVNTTLYFSAADYSHSWRLCRVDLRHYPFEKDWNWYRLMYASTLVHEATHGVISSRCIPYTRKTLVRIERLCHEEERRFLRRFGTWYAEGLGELDEKRLLSEWGCWARCRMGWRHIKEVIEEEKLKGAS